MIFVHDKGRMANNILQYGHVYAWGREHNRQTMSMRFAYKYPHFHISHTRHHNFPTYVFAKYAAKWGLIPTVSFDEPLDEEKKEIVDRELLNRKYNMVLVSGWYARWYDLFLKYKPEILQLFAFDDKIEHKVAETMKTSNGLRLGVHIRRGDYATFQGGRFLYSDEQYIAVIRQFCSLHPEEPLTIYICGNDPKLNKDYFREELRGEGGNERTIVFPEGSPTEDLCLLSHCNYLIGAPSTFSLVAAMYRDLPLYWIENPDSKLTEDSFRRFDYLFRHIY
ncbi:MAG: alpha-1,2-fucosyltransferase [Prevotella sp.]|nr:alpha-1,2-fucosyltransferase [Prevotella sp.]